MRMNRLLLALTISGFTGPFTNWAVGQEPSLSPLDAQPMTSVGRLSDEPSTISDAAVMPRSEFLAPDNRPEEFRSNFVDPARSGSKISDDLRGSISDDKLSYATPSLLTSQETEVESPTNTDSTTIYTGNEVVSYVPRSSGRVFGMSSDWWAETEALLWFARQSSSPPLVVTGPAGVRPTTVLAGGNELLGGGLSTGMRANIGKWLNSDQSLGVGGRVFGIFDGDSTKTFNSDQYPVLGVPVFDIFSGTDQEILVASPAGDTGNASVGSELDFVSAEAYGKVLLAKSSNARADFVAGYTFLRYDNATILRTTSIDAITNGTPDLIVTNTVDAFGAKNTFHGGHLGLQTEVKGGYMTLSTLTKIALGNMSTTTNVFGSTVENDPLSGITTTDRGLITDASRTGSQARDRFTFIPEIGAKLKADLTKRLQFSVGYTLIVLPEVGVASDLINTTIDSSGIIGLPPTPGGVLRDQVSYIQGIDLGVTLKF